MHIANIVISLVVVFVLGGFVGLVVGRTAGTLLTKSWEDQSDKEFFVVVASTSCAILGAIGGAFAGYFGLAYGLIYLFSEICSIAIVFCLIRGIAIAVLCAIKVAFRLSDLAVEYVKHRVASR